jgi:phosphopantothenoylcysteine decarboxylase/phosphopantothenate--cysteine ligase
MLKGKTILLGVTGSIAAYKAAALASSLKKAEADVHVVMTKNAAKLVTPITFEALTGNRVSIDTFDPAVAYKVEHISLAKKADLVLIAPATANIIAKLANGLADDMLSTTVLASTCPKLIAPAMNTNMYQNPVTQQNLDRLRTLDWTILTPGSGRLACGDVGVGKMAEPEELFEAVMHELAHEKDMAGMRVLVTAGPTQEAIDPVRFISNHSSGKMGYAIARAAAQRGAIVTLVSGKTSLNPPSYVDVIPVSTAEEMFEAVIAKGKDQDIIIKAAAVADYTPVETASEKIKKSEGDSTLVLRRTTDILKYLGDNRVKVQYLCGFSMETEQVIENSRKKLTGKGVDMIAANSLREEDAGFGADTNRLTLITAKDEIALPLLTKEEAAHRLLDEILKRLG